MKRSQRSSKPLYQRADGTLMVPRARRSEPDRDGARKPEWSASKPLGWWRRRAKRRHTT